MTLITISITVEVLFNTLLYELSNTFCYILIKNLYYPQFSCCHRSWRNGAKSSSSELRIIHEISGKKCKQWASGICLCNKKLSIYTRLTHTVTKDLGWLMKISCREFYSIQLSMCTELLFPVILSKTWTFVVFLQGAACWSTEPCWCHRRWGGGDHSKKLGENGGFHPKWFHHVQEWWVI